MSLFISKKAYTKYKVKKSKKINWFPFIILGEITLITLLIFSIYILAKNNTAQNIIQEEIPSKPITEKPEDLVTEEIFEPVVIEIETEENSTSSEETLFEYIEVTGGCGPHFEGECLNVRSGPGTIFPSVAKLRNGIVLKIDNKIENEGKVWYRIIFDEWLRYPERVKDDWYVDASYVQSFFDEGVKTSWEDPVVTTNKEIVIDISEQKLYAYDSGQLIMDISISTGLELTPTPRGQYTVFKKTPTRYMQGPLPNLIDQQYYDLPGVPWNLYFTDGGAVIHGAYWHNSFGSRYSHGCVNLPPDRARELYHWSPLGTKVIVKD